MLHQKAPDAEFRDALKWLEKALELSPQFFEAWYSKARLYYRWAEWKLGTGQNAMQEIQRGLEMVKKVLEINPNSGEMLGLRGVFLLFQARSVSNHSQHNELMRKAQSNLEDALRINANLSRTFLPYLKEAKASISK